MKITPREPRNDPSYGQTKEQIEAYYRNVQIGDVAIIRNTQGGILEFKITTITGTNPKIGRVYLAHAAPWGGNAFYMKHGKNCRAATGQSSLVVPTSEVLAWIEINPHGTFDWSPGYPSILSLAFPYLSPKDKGGRTED